MATKLQNLKVTKVDFVDEGANPDAHIKLFKRKEGPGEEPETNESVDKGGAVWKRLISAIAKIAGIKPEELGSAVEEIEKGGSESFGEKMAQRKNQKIADEMWDICFALQSSLCSIMWDEELDSTSASTAMQESLDEFYAVVKESISQWSNGTVTGLKNSEETSEANLAVLKSARDRLNDTIEKASTDNEEDGPKGEEEMKIDKSKLTPAEKAFLEEIEKRYGEDNGTGEAAPAQQTAPVPTQTAVPEAAPATGAEGAVAKALQTLGLTVPVQTVEQQETSGSGEDIYKGLHPQVKAELEALRKFREESEDAAIRSIAKRYEIIGKKEEELFPVLKSLKAAGGTAYDDMIAILDQTKETVEKSGIFGEVGKSGHPAPDGSDGSAWAQAEAKAVELMKSKTGITKAQALDEVFQGNPDLVKKCEEITRVPKI